MKNFLLLAVLLVGAYYVYAYPQAEPAPQPVAVAAPAPPAPKQYFHSSLDAPAMSTHESTGTGYYSSETTSHFSTYQNGYVSSAQAAGGYPIYTGTTNNTAIVNNYGAQTSTLRAPASGQAYINTRTANHGVPRTSVGTDGQRLRNDFQRTPSN